MKSNVLLTSMAAMLVMGAANAAQYTPFIGATLGLQQIVYSNEAKDAAKISNMDLPEDFFSFGIEGGVRFGAHDKIYNGGITVNIDATTESDIENKFTDTKIGSLSMFNASATYDNYLRLSGDKLKRIDLVLGAGLGTMNYHIDWKDSSVDDETVYSPTLAFKIGVDFELTKHLSLSANTRFFVPTRSHYTADTTYIVGGAVRYMF